MRTYETYENYERKNIFIHKVRNTKTSLSFISILFLSEITKEYGQNKSCEMSLQTGNQTVATLGDK